jgi:hypothetical protein
MTAREIVEYTMGFKENEQARNFKDHGEFV